MNGNAMRKKLGPVADDIAMFLSGIDGFPTTSGISPQ